MKAIGTSRLTAVAAAATLSLCGLAAAQAPTQAQAITAHTAVQSITSAQTAGTCVYRPDRSTALRVGKNRINFSVARGASCSRGKQLIYAAIWWQPLGMNRPFEKFGYRCASKAIMPVHYRCTKGSAAVRFSY